MADERYTIGLRAGYAVRGRRGTGRVGWHAVSEEVRVPVSYMDMADAPVAFKVERRFDNRTDDDRHAWGDRPWKAIPPVPATGNGVDRFDIRSTPNGGLLAPVPGPWGSGTVTPETLAAYAKEVGAVDGVHGWRYRILWARYPGQIPPSMKDHKTSERWPAPTSGVPGRPVAACPDLAGQFLTVDEGLRAEALDAFRARCAGLALLDRTLWRPCGAPLVAVGVDGRGRVVVPGHDTPEAFGRGILALANVGTPAGRGHMPKDASSTVTGSRTTDVEAWNVRSLASHVGAAVRAVRVGSLSPAWLPLVHGLATLVASPDGEAAWPSSDATLALVREAAEAWRLEAPRPGSPDDALLCIAQRWAAVQEGERDLRGTRRTKRFSPTQGDVHAS